MKKIVECVPNFSEGRDKKIIDALFEAACAVKGVKVFELEYNPSHNRCLFTIVGEPQKVSESVFAAIKEASKLIDMNKHGGEHPRIGACDVVPFVPVSGINMQECIEISVKLAERISKELNIPVYLYEESAKYPERRNLAEIRKGEYEGLKEEIKVNPSKKPDFGRSEFHPTAGAVVVGARKYLVAYNINLDTDKVDIAKEIASKIREKDGGMKAVKALGFLVDNKAQVSMNLVDFNLTNFDEVYREVEKLTKKYDVKIASSEIYGMIPLLAVVRAIQKSFKAGTFSEDQVLEKRLYE